MTFAFPTLLYAGVPLLLGVLAIHLLNLRRQKPVRWAAMDFLLESERINKAWINLRQWLLLAARLLVIALAVVALARPQLKQFSLAALTESRVLHVVVLDDSYSMSDQGAASSAWADAAAAVDRVLAFAAERPQHQVVLLRTSRAASAAADDPPRADDADAINGLRTALADSAPSQTAGRLAQAIEEARGACEAAPAGARTVAYIVTDQRRKDIEPVADLARRVEELQQAGAEVRWVSCVATHHPNLTVSRLRPLPGPEAAGVELRMEVAVTNNGPTAAAQTLLQVERDGRSSPAIEVGEIASGQTVTREFAVLFREPGPHRLTLRADSDAVEADNTRRACLTLATHRDVLLVDGSPDGREGAPYAAALRPSPRLNTGWLPELVTPAKLSGVTNFDKYAAVFLLDVEKLSEATAAALTEYVKAGGGLLVSAGASADRGFYNRWLLGDREHAVVPIVLDKQGRPPRAGAPEQGDLVVDDHPVFKVFSGERDGFLSLVKVNYLHTLRPVAPRGSCRVIASHASGAPLFIENHLGAGRAVAMLTTAGQSLRQDESWSNLSTLPVFPVLALELAAHLAEPRLRAAEFAVGDSWSRVVDAAPDARVRIGRVGAEGVSASIAQASGAELAAIGGPPSAGFYTIDVDSPRGKTSAMVAANVDPAEGDLTPAPADGLIDALARLGVPVETAVALSASAGDDGPSPLPPLLALVMVGLLVGEQALAVSASYHESRRGGRVL